MGKKTLVLTEKQIEKVRQGLIAYENNEPDYEIGFEKPVDMSSYAHVVNKNFLNEENRTQKRKCVEQIIQHCPSMIRKYLDIELNKLPDYLKTMLQPDSAMFQHVANNQNGCNKFIDYLRLNLYSQFGIGRKSNLVFFIPGISRIACDDLHFYSFDESVKGGEIITFGRLLKLFNYKKDLMFTDVNLDSNFNGMSYSELMNVFGEKLKIYRENMKQELSEHAKVITTDTNYKIFEIPDKIINQYGVGGLVPTEKGVEILKHFGKYCNWCICDNMYGIQEYTQYLSNGGRMYICAKKGYETIEKIQGENCPLDEYGLSLICVIVGGDGLPDIITTRWNHDFGGENHENLWEAIQLQKVLNLDFSKIFTPRSKDELRQLHLHESRQINEETKPDDVDLSSFKIQDKLNPKFWKNNKLDSRIRLKLLDIADDFVDFLNVTWVEPEDITITGSLANYTWNEKYSDIDLHILYDFNEIDERTEFVKEYFDGKKKEWNDIHENLKIYDFPIEVYVQNINEKHGSSGVYSLEKNDWITEPDKDNFDENDYDDDTVKTKVSDYMNKIDELIDELEEKTLETDIEDIYNKAVSLFSKIKSERDDELKAKNPKELSNGNLIFKSLRRNGYIEKIVNLRNNSYDKCNSLV